MSDKRPGFLRQTGMGLGIGIVLAVVIVAVLSIMVRLLA